MKITLSTEWLDLIDTKTIQYIHPDMHQWFHLPSGKEHYRLLIHLGFSMNNKKISDIGTYRGVSAVALGQNRNNKVTSFDVVDVKCPIHMDNVDFVIGDFKTNVDIQKKILVSDFIFLDVDHLYNNEIWLYNFLSKSNWKGLLVCDDIYLNDEMKRFWSEITHPKFDITQYGHFSGTGAVVFNGAATLNLI